MYRAIIHATELITGKGVRAKDGRHIVESDLGVIPDGAMVYSVDRSGVPEKIVWVGPTASLPSKFRRVKTQNLKNQRALVPGFVDCHTHLVFAGDRSDEFAQRCAGTTYEEIAARGGGILSTVRATRAATKKQLLALAIPRVKEMISYGVRTIEIKSGYGLSFEDEIKCLEVIPDLRKKFPQILFTATFLGAHAFPLGSTREEYLNDLVKKMLPEVARRKLADSCDVFVDRGYYTRDEGRALLSAAKKLGLKIKVHADELANTESASLAVEMNALSADHLLRISDAGIRALAASSTVAVLLPGTSFYLKTEPAPARRLIDAGACVAISTDFNPGSCMCLSLPVMMTFAALYYGMSRAEIFSAVTYGGAKALGLQKNLGALEPGDRALFTVLPFAKFEEVYYRFAAQP